MHFDIGRFLPDSERLQPFALCRFGLKMRGRGSRDLSMPATAINLSSVVRSL